MQIKHLRNLTRFILCILSLLTTIETQPLAGKLATLIIITFLSGKQKYKELFSIYLSLKVEFNFRRKRKT